MEVVAQAVLSVSLEALFSQLGSSDLLKFARQEKIHAELKKWGEKLLEIREVLNDAEDKQIEKQSVKAWLGDLRDLAYDMEDILDEFAYEDLRRKVTAEADGEASTSKVRKFIPSCCTSFTPIDAMRNVKMRPKIKEITARLEGIYAQKAALGLDKVAAITQSTWERPLTTSLVYEPWVYGRDADKQIIIDMLLRDEPTETNVSVVSIVAMGGMGKTTLARLVYDDAETTKHFNLKAWVCVSDQFDAVRITKTILNEVTSSSNDSLDFSQIQDRLRKELMGRKFLLVLDDMWNENYGDWRCLQSPFLSGSRGSKIIVTTRSKKVANMMEGDKNLHELKNLSDDECWSVFTKHAFGNSNIDEHSNLALIGKEIVKKCGGLPLAATALGGLLRHEQREDKWTIILTSKIWDLPGDKCGILPALRLSYNHLPSPLKRCFSYCAIFPKDYEFDKKQLIHFWMAESLIQQSECHGQQIENEDLGDDYFQELLSRSFFQPSTSNKSQFVMHDLVNDLAKFVAGEMCFSLEENLESNQQQTISKKACYSSFTRSRFEIYKKFEAFHKMEHLRTFMALPINASWHWLSNKVLEELMPKLRRLRVLSLSGYNINEIPNSVGDLKHLRYLNLSRTVVKLLPDSIGNLYNLETLILSHCGRLIRLPMSIENLNKLRHLDLTDTNLEEMPPQISKLNILRVLSNFIVGKDNDLNIKELKNMPNLRGGLCISKLENVANVGDARDASLNRKHKIENLTTEWSAGLDDSYNARNQIDVLDSLQPHSNLNELNIRYYGGREFPRWIGDASFCKMVDINLVNCRNCTSLPCLGRLPMLKRLKIGGLNEVKSVGREFYGETCLPNKPCPFPSLESLSFFYMSQWEDWESPSLWEPYPRLLNLTIQHCPKLIKKLPTYLPFLEYLSIWDCPQLGFPLARLPSLSKLHLESCNEAVITSGIHLSSLTELRIARMEGQLTRLYEGFIMLLPGLQVLKFYKCDELRCFWENGFDGIQQLQTSSCPELASLGEKEKHELPSKLRSLNITDCVNLEKLPNGLHRLTCLGELEIHRCPKLVSFPELGFPPILRRLVIVDCEGLRRLPDWMMVMREGTTNSSSNNKVCALEYLRIDECPSLIGFPEGELPSTLRELWILGCKKLESLPGGMMDNDSNTTTTGGLHLLTIGACSSLTFFPTGKFPSTLKELHIKDCSQLESISEKMFHSDNNSLESLTIWRFPSLKIIPDCLYKLKELHIENCENMEWLPHQLQNLTALTSLTITYCENVELLPHQLQNLTALTSLTISYCENVDLLPQLQNLTALTSLTISHCENVKMPLTRWGLATLTSLKRLTIGGMFPEVTSFSDAQREPLLPTTLTSLSIRDFQNLKSLSSLALQTLTSLDELQIHNCPKLQSFCPKDGLPDMLSRLIIQGCPFLKRRCSKEKGQDWLNIAHIPYVQIDKEIPLWAVIS